MFLKKYVKNKEIRNATWLIGEQIFQMLISLIIGILTARYLGPQNYGSLSYTASFVSFFTSIATLGMEGVVIKKLIEHPELEGEYLGTAMLFRVISAILSSIMIAVIVFVLNPEEDIKVILALLQSIQLVFQAVYILDSWFQRYLYQDMYL
ncbi:hypothetical protein DWX73_13200 [Coprococcus sp. AF21-14LB]|nr:oligosaccharide flippase family protein [Coprococcus sp. AF21-14LB]RGS75188.1 hypothetical protein DWX73_13200 [Coprococcus sp. AF21-14LB]